MSARKVLFRLALAGLGALGWFAMLPVWAEGPGGVALNADGQPALWMWAAKAAVLLGGGAFFVGRAGYYEGADGLSAARRLSFAAGTALFAASAILFFAMLGQPLRAWFLLSTAHLAAGTTQAALAFALCYVYLAFGGIHPAKGGNAASWVGRICYLALATILLPPAGFFIGAGASSALAVLLAWGRISPDRRGTVLAWAGGALVLAAGTSVLASAPGGALLAAAGITTMAMVRLGRMLSRAAACIPALMAVSYPYWTGEGLPSSDFHAWLVICFASACGVFAGWARAKTLFSGAGGSGSDEKCKFLSHVA
ncbi:MAG: hypothetical protein ACOZEN_03485 [Thermodesulfobacteriota bacterium]